MRTIRDLIIGAVALVTAAALTLRIVGNPLDELRLLTSAAVAEGRIVETGEEPEDGEEGQTIWFHSCVYTYELPDGRRFRASRSGSGRLLSQLVNSSTPIPIQVEYLPTAPEISRLRGEGSQSILEWAFRRLVLGCVILGGLAAPGVSIVLGALRKKSRNATA